MSWYYNNWCYKHGSLPTFASFPLNILNSFKSILSSSTTSELIAPFFQKLFLEPEPWRGDSPAFYIEGTLDPFLHDKYKKWQGNHAQPPENIPEISKLLLLNSISRKPCQKRSIVSSQRSDSSRNKFHYLWSFPSDLLWSSQAYFCLFPELFCQGLRFFCSLATTGGEG